MGWTKSQRNVVIAAYLGWTLDAFDFFLMVFMFKDIAADLHSSRQVVVEAVLLTLAMRPIGAFLFGRLGDRFGRKPTLMWNILAFSVLEAGFGLCAEHDRAARGRALFGIAMGGEWGLGSALDHGEHPGRARAARSRACCRSAIRRGYFLASLAMYLFYDRLGWRYMFVLGVVPAILVFFIRMASRRIAGLAPSSAPRPSAGIVAVLAARLEAGRVRHRAHDGVQFLQPRLAGRLSESVLEGSASLRHAPDRR